MPLQKIGLSPRVELHDRAERQPRKPDCRESLVLFGGGALQAAGRTEQDVGGQAADFAE